MAHINNFGKEENIKPKMTLEDTEMILFKYYGLEGGSVKELSGYDDLNYHLTSARVSSNPHIKGLWPHGYVLKIMNSLDSKKDELCEAQNEMMLFLREHNIPSPQPVKTLSGKHYIKEKFPQKASPKEQKEHIVRLLEFQPGIVLKSIQKSHSLLYQLGVFIGEINEVLKKFFHPVYETHKSIWQLDSVPELKPYTSLVENQVRRQLIETVLKEFIDKVLSKKKDLGKGMIHGDFNEHNVLVLKGEDGGWKISAILDFGDAHKSCYLFELAIALCYMMIECKRQGLDAIVSVGHFLSGYLTVRPTFQVDYNLLKICICARICQSLILGLKTFRLNPQNCYVLDSQDVGWPLLEELWEIRVEDIKNKWDSVFVLYNVNNNLNISK